MSTILERLKPSVLKLAALFLASGVGVAKADRVIDTFDNEAATGTWTATWGTAPVLSFAAANAGGGGAGSGSLQVAADYFTPADNGWEQMVITRTFDTPVIGAQYTSVSVDVKVDPASVLSSGGNYGYFEFKRPDGSALGGLNLTSTEWTTVTFNLAPTEGTLTGIIIQNGNGGFQGPIIYQLDNFKFNSPPAPQTVINRFDEATEVDAWSATWGTSPVLEFDAQNGGGGAAGSGSLKVTADYFTPEDNGWEQMVITRSFDTPVAGSQHVSVSVNIKVDPVSVLSAGGNYGYFEFKRTDGSALGGVNLTSTEWTTVTFDIPPTEGDLTGIIIQNGNGGFQGPIIYYLDNFVFTQKSGGTPPPTLAIAANRAPGLRLYASAPGQAYQRQNVVYLPSETIDNSLWWVNQNAPVSYSVTWAEFPNPATAAGFQGHIMLATDTTGSNTPDWNDANVILIEFQYVNTAGPDGQNGTADDVVRARARFLHKVNEPASNAMLYRTQANAAAGPVGVLGEVWAPSMLGTWTVTFKNNTEIDLTASDGTVASIVMPEANFPSFEPATAGVSAHFGVQPNADTRIGLSAVISKIKITKGTTTVVDESFQSAALDTAVWAIRAADAAGIFPAPADLAYFVSWNLPDTGFSLKAAPRVTGAWVDASPAILVGARRLVAVPRSALPSAESGFFQLVNSGTAQ